MGVLLVLDSILLFALSIPVVMKYRILPIEGTPYWLFGLLFILLIIHTSISFFLTHKKWQFSVSRIKTISFWLILGIVVVGVTMTSIVDRHKVAPVWGVHDIILQQEAAMRYLIQGKDPYKETYFGTPVESFNYDELGKSAVNPALYHFVMPPWYLLFPFPFYFVANRTLGYFDGRMVLLVCLFGLGFILSRWFKDRKVARIAIILIALSPATVDYFIEGRSDMFALFWLVASLYFLDKGKLYISSILFSFAMLSKQTIWFAVPFYGVLLWLKTNKSIQTVVRVGAICVALSTVIVLPFLLWDARAFVDSVILYLSGGGLHGYPVSGYGLSMVLYQLGIIKDIHAYYPFILWQLILGIPVILILSIWLLKKYSLSRFFIAYSISLFVIWYVSRYFNNSHIAYISSISILGLLKDYDEHS